MQCVHKKSLHLLVVLVFILLQPSISFGQRQPIVDPSVYYYPTPVLASKSYPNLYFQVGNGIHVRDALTGQTKQVIKIETEESIVDCDRDSILLYCPAKSNDGQLCFKRFDLNGTNETFVIEKLVTEGIKHNPQNMVFINKKPYFFYETGDTYNKSYKFTVQSSEGILWTGTNNENEWWGYGGCFSYKDENIVAISLVTSQQNFSTKLFDLATGNLIKTVDGYCFIKKDLANSDSSLIPFAKCNQNSEFCLYDIRDNEIVYKKSIPNWYYTKYFDNAIWLTTIEGSINLYRFNDGGSIRIIKIGLDGKELENFTITPTIPNLPIYSFQIATNQVGALLAKHKTILYNFRTNQKLLELDIDLPEIYSHNGKILLETTSELVCIDEETLEPVWKLNVARTDYIKEFETNKSIYLLNNVYDHKGQCDATQVKNIDKTDNSLEPYEFFVSPFYGDESKIYDSPYGLVFISDSNICSFAIGGFERFKIKDISGIESWKSMEDPKLIEIKTSYGKNYIVNAETGVYSVKIKE